MTMALKEVSLKLPDKGMVFILGKSGSGKSTLLNVLTGIDVANSGVVEVCKVPITTFNQRNLDNYRNGMIGFIFQEFNLIEDMNVFENIVLALQLQNKKPDFTLINDLMKQVGLDVSFLNRIVNELSGGQKQRVAIVRALVKNPKMVFADEPTGNLDSETGTQVFDLLQNLSKEKLVVIVSHDIENAYKYADRILECKDGKVLSDMTRKKDTTKKIKDKMLVFKEGQVLTSEIIANLTGNPALENFDKTDETKVLQQDTDFVSFPSRLPFSFFAKSALKSFKNKKLFLILSVLITTIAASFFGLTTFPTLSGKIVGAEKKLFHMKKLLDEKIEKDLKKQSKNQNYYNHQYMMKEELEEIKIFYDVLGEVNVYFRIRDVINNKWTILFILFVPGAMVMLYFSMSAKIQNKKMGILRVLGSNGVNVGKIFVVEAFFFAFFQMVLIFVFFLLFLMKFSSLSYFFSSFEMEPLKDFENVEEILTYYKEAKKEKTAELLKAYGEKYENKKLENWKQPIIDKYFNSVFKNKYYVLARWGNMSFYAFNPFVRVFLFNLLTFSYIFFVTLLFISLIIYKLSNKKPVDIINNK
ncbi:ABC transporter ATP-binding protein [Aster yellows witches'-broom phytoplasma AYWB]|uniref:ABC transporter ATP-binding protein n=1 Tax=Aster yellows witches'-broom phytoplasma (strain AYWB) TaxID=322098 RepID=Q2NJZ1_AYWBP|nr:ABC transporter ATP-binding protein [Aster yellows witches'-broom phytoplasma]ABC65252.1 ABC transporter ATP-binding protein [Aster yellows witches'-broom phytoplasma AYWB]